MDLTDGEYQNYQERRYRMSAVTVGLGHHRGAGTGHVDPDDPSRPVIIAETHFGSLDDDEDEHHDDRDYAIAAYPPGVSDPNAAGRVHGASDPRTDPDRLRELASDSDYDVRNAAAMNRATPGDALRKLAEDDEDEIRDSVAGNPSTPVDVLDSLALWDEADGVRESAAGNPSTSTETLRQQLRDDETDPYVREISMRSLRSRRFNRRS